MAEKDGARWIGRFIKKDGKLFKVVRVHDYIFRDMNSFSAPIMDNPSVNIIHKRLHDEEELATYVRKHETFNNSLQDPNSKGAVIFPRDFTNDWNIQAKRLSDRHEHEDDDDDEEDLNEETGTEENKKLDSLINLTNEAKTSSSDELSTEEKQDSVVPSTQAPKSEPGNVLNIIKDDFEDPEFKDELAPQDTSPIPEAPIVISEEPRPLETAEAPIESGREFKEIVNQISQIKETFKGLRKEILLEAQDQFFEITKILCESLLEKQIEIDKMVFVDLIKRALSEAMPSDEFQIFVSTNFFKKLDELNLGDFQKHFHEDSSLAETSFRIESKDSRLETSLKDLTTKLLNQIEGSIFTNQMASTSKD